MTSISATLQRGMPPTGLGIFLHGRWIPGPWHFAAINAWRSDAAMLARTAQAAGCDVWLYGMPTQFTPSAWAASLATLKSRADSIPGVVGLIIDAEMDWSASDNAQATAMGHAAAALSSDYRIGITSYPTWAGLAPFAQAAGESVFGLVQVYGRTSQNPVDWAAWLRRWQAFFGTRLGMATAGWVTNPAWGTPEGFATYLSGLPAVPSAIVWPEGDTIPPFIITAYNGYQPGGNVFGTLGLAAIAELTRPPALVAIGVAVVVVMCIAFVAAGWRR